MSLKVEPMSYRPFYAIIVIYMATPQNNVEEDNDVEIVPPIMMNRL